MNKYYFLFFFIIFTSSSAFAQNNFPDKLTTQELERKLSSTPQNIDLNVLKQSRVNHKAFQDTLFYTSFPNGLPAGWSIVNNKSNAFQWAWDTIYRPGQFSQSSNIISSTSVTDGFMSLTADLFNTPIPPGGAISMDTYFESTPIDLTNSGANPNGVGSVWVSYQQTLRACCNGAIRLVLQVSTDNFTTLTEYDATNALPIGGSSGTLSNVIDISSAAANSASIKIRFLSEGNSHYYWMIDDFSIFEGPEFDMRLDDAHPEFNNSYLINPFYSQIPNSLFNPLTFSGIISNGGSVVASNPHLEVIVTNDSLQITPSSPKTAGLGIQYSSTQFSTKTNFAIYVSDTMTVGNTTPFIPSVFGDFSILLMAKSDSLDQNPLNNNESYKFSLTDTTMAKDNNNLQGSFSPASFVRNGSPGGTAPGDKLATKFIIEPNLNTNPQAANPIPTSISFLVSNDSNNIGASIIPKIWDFTLNEVAASSPYLIQSSAVGNWITLPLNSGVGVTNGLVSGEYYVGWETTAIPGGSNFSVQEDLSSGVRQPNFTTLIDFGHDPGWGFTSPTNPGIRLNFGKLLLVTNINNSEILGTLFSIYPNPNNGQFKLNITTNSSAAYTLTVKNILGQSIHNEPINVNGQITKQLDLRTFEKGIYLVSLENELEKVVRKVILK